METIGKQELWSFTTDSSKVRSAENSAVRMGKGHYVRSFLELATRVAELQFRNRDHVLLFRGQARDHLNMKGYSSLKPSLLRPMIGKATNPSATVLLKRFAALKRAELILVKLYEQHEFPALERLKRQRILRWSILQHYEVCRTPLLDVTQSLRIAASFASMSPKGDGFILVVGIPNVSGAVTASAEAGLQIVRLSSVCPPTAIRPHVQEGYLLGEYPEMGDLEQKAQYPHYEIDFGRRLVTKFRLSPTSFWKGDAFPMVRGDALYPPADQDPLYRLALDVKRLIKSRTSPS